MKKLQSHFPYVSIDDYSAARSVMQRLLKKGQKQIALMNGLPPANRQILIDADLLVRESDQGGRMNQNKKIC